MKLLFFYCRSGSHPRIALAKRSYRWIFALFVFFASSQMLRGNPAAHLDRRLPGGTGNAFAGSFIGGISLVFTGIR